MPWVCCRMVSSLSSPLASRASGDSAASYSSHSPTISSPQRRRAAARPAPAGRPARRPALRAARRPAPAPARRRRSPRRDRGSGTCGAAARGPRRAPGRRAPSPSGRAARCARPRSRAGRSEVQPLRVTVLSRSAARRKASTPSRSSADMPKGSRGRAGRNLVRTGARSGCMSSTHSHRRLDPHAAVVSLGLPVSVHAQQGSGCEADSTYSALNFWLGEWDVLVGGQVVGTNRITRMLKGCAVLEEWRDANGRRGTQPVLRRARHPPVEAGVGDRRRRAGGRNEGKAPHRPAARWRRPFPGRAASAGRTPRPRPHDAHADPAGRGPPAHRDLARRRGHLARGRSTPATASAVEIAACVRRGESGRLVPPCRHARRWFSLSSLVLAPACRRDAAAPAEPRPSGHRRAAPRRRRGCRRLAQLWLRLEQSPLGAADRDQPPDGAGPPPALGARSGRPLPARSPKREHADRGRRPAALHRSQEPGDGGGRPDRQGALALSARSQGGRALLRGGESGGGGLRRPRLPRHARRAGHRAGPPDRQGRLGNHAASPAEGYSFTMAPARGRREDHRGRERRRVRDPRVRGRVRSRDRPADLALLDRSLARRREAGTGAGAAPRPTASPCRATSRRSAATAPATPTPGKRAARRCTPRRPTTRSAISCSSSPPGIRPRLPGPPAGRQSVQHLARGARHRHRRAQVVLPDGARTTSGTTTTRARRCCSTSPRATARSRPWPRPARPAGSTCSTAAPAGRSGAAMPFVPLENIFPRATRQGVRASPGVRGGANWPPPAYSPADRPAVRAGQLRPDAASWWTRRSTGRRRAFQSGHFVELPDSAHLRHRLGDRPGHRQDPLAASGAPAAHVRRRGGDGRRSLLFYGDIQGYLYALDAETGETLWQDRAAKGYVGPPIAFRLDGHDRVAITSREGIVVYGLDGKR